MISLKTPLMYPCLSEKSTALRAGLPFLCFVWDTKIESAPFLWARMTRPISVVWSHTTKSMLMNSQSRKSKICSSLMTEPSLSLIHAERNPRNSVVQEPEQDTKSLTVKYVFTVTTCPCSTRTAPQTGERHLPCYIFLFTLFIANKLR